MNKLYIFIAILLFPLSVFAHGSTMGDILIWKGDTLRLDSNPLKFRTDRDSLEKQILNEVKRQTKATFPDEDENGLWLCSWISGRSYQIEWVVQNDSIFLNNIYPCRPEEMKISLNSIFPDNKGNEKIFASWINGELFVPQGECMPKNNCFFGGGADFRSYMHEYETVLYVENGLLKSYETFQNRIIKISNTWQNQIINNNINWKILPDLSDGRFVLLLIDVQPNEQGQLENILEDGITLFDNSSDGTFITDTNNAFIQEGIRILKLIPEWHVILQRGKIRPMQLTINFTESYIRKFGRNEQ